MRFSRVREVTAPQRGTADSAGIDLFIPKFTDDYMMTLSRENPNFQSQCLPEPQRKIILVRPHGQVKIPTGIRVEVPKDHVLWVANKSGASWSPTLTKVAEIIDFGYQGELFITLHNYSAYPLQIGENHKFIQLICVPVNMDKWEEVPDDQMHLTPTERGEGSMGSTNRG